VKEPATWVPQRKWNPVEKAQEVEDLKLNKVYM
jgi:hypothetical protein